MFRSTFPFSHLQTAVFRFWGLPRFVGFLEFSLWFSVSSTMMAFFCPVHIGVFLVLPRKLHPAVALKPTYFQGPFILPSTLSFRGMDDKRSPFSSRYLGCNGKAQDNIKGKDYFSDITQLG